MFENMFVWKYNLAFLKERKALTFYQKVRKRKVLTFYKKVRKRKESFYEKVIFLRF